MRYKVYLQFTYSDIVHVEADSRKEAEEKALKECSEEYEAYHDCTITEEE